MSMTMNRKETRYIIVHCSATSPSMAVDAAMIDRWHRAKGWLGIGYHKVIRRDGVVEPGRDENTVGAHTLNYNAFSVAVCLAGGVAEGTEIPETNFTDAQWAALEQVVREWLVKWPDAKVCGHRDLNATACPTFDVAAWWQKVNPKESA